MGVSIGSWKSQQVFASEVVVSESTGREVSASYRDPLEVVWLTAARELGMRVERSHEVFASWDGDSTLTIGAPETLDADDSLAQMIFHEICHALIEGPEGWGQVDFGLAGRTVVHEHACLRLQAKLADRHGLRKFLASTTEFRGYYDALPGDPFAASDDPALGLAVAGWERLCGGEWLETLERALGATAQIAAVVQPFAESDSLWAFAGGSAEAV